jgi:hypothetical protein
MIYLVLLLLFIYILYCCQYKRYETYENDIPSTKPDTTIFIPESSNDYKLKTKEVQQPLKGPYTDFLNTYNIYNYSDAFTSPDIKDTFTDIKELNKSKDNEYQNYFKTIIDNEDTDQISNDPFFLQGSANYNGSTFIYSNEMNEELSTFKR